MRILLLSRHHAAEIRGATVATHGLARALRDRGHEVTLVHSARQEHRLRIEGITLRYHRTTRKSLYPLLYALGRLGAYDMIHANDESGGVVALRSRLSHLPLAAHVHASPVHDRSFWRAGWRWRYIELAVRNAPLVITPSGWAADRLAERYRRCRADFRPIPNGIGEHWFRARSSTAPHAGGPQRVVNINMQGVDVALRAFRRLPEGIDARLEIYGTHGRQPEYARLARELGIEERVRFCGFVPNPELPGRIVGADLLVHPSRRESFGQVLGEAAALGLPVLTSQVHAIPEVVEEGQTGILCPVDDVDAFAAALACLLEDADLRRRLGAAARQRAERLWRWDRVAARLEAEVYAPLAEG